MASPVFAPTSMAGASGGGNSGMFELPNFGSNQYMSYPTQSPSYGFGNQFNQSYYGSPAMGTSQNFGGGIFGGGYNTTPVLDPSLTGQLGSYLSGQVGQGVPGFNLPTALPTGGTTAPGSLSAPINQNSVLQQLMQFMTGQGSASSLPGVLPMWQSELSAMQIPEQNQLADIKEQFGSMGALGSSEMANALETYGAQTAADQQALLTQATQQALPGMLQAGMGIQDINQQAINSALQEFNYTLPQNNPLMGEMYGMSTTFPPTVQQGGGALAGLMGALPGLGGSIYEGLSGGGGLSGLGSSLAGMGLAF